MDNEQDKFDALGITRDTIIIEIEEGRLVGVHNDSNGYLLFDWDYIKEEGKKEVKLHLKRLEDILKCLGEEQ